MSRFKNYAKKSIAEERSEYSAHEEEQVINFMDGTSYTLDPLMRLKFIAASSIFGEPSYYRSSEHKKSYLSEIHTKIYDIFVDFKENKTTDQIFIDAIDSALNYNFKGVLDLAVELRTIFNMRMNPAVIIVRAAIHPKRVSFTNSEGYYFRRCIEKVILRPDDITNQFEYYLYINKSKKNLPSILKRAWANKLNSFDRYRINKYKSKSLIDLIRISHPSKPSETIKELMSTGTIKQIGRDILTWEYLKSQGKTWNDILHTITIPHMALLRNLRGIFSEPIIDFEFANNIIKELKSKVLYGKQFPFRYYSAFNMIQQCDDINYKQLLLDSLNECIDTAMDNFPKLSGKTMCLIDNSGSAKGTFVTEKSTVRMNTIGNLSGIMTGYNSDEGYIGIFGDGLSIFPISKRNGILNQLDYINKIGEKMPGGTENGIWLFFDGAIKNKEHYDNIFIYSDMQAGHGGLYGIDPSKYKAFAMPDKRHIDVFKLVLEYRRLVNKKVNVYSVQIAGYDNSVLPQNTYRTTLLSGWTGNEVLYADNINKYWDEIDSQK